MSRGVLRETGAHDSTIQVLAPDVAARIAAGEVVERPANAAKELIENSLDAGATVVRVEAREGGRRLLKVSDNGAGIPAADVALALHRHATSKLQRSEQLEEIITFGFRGEALYSIAATSHMILQSRHRADEYGVELVAEGGAVQSTQRIGAPAGTSVTVEHLFFNMPARLKFLRSATGEAGQVAAVVQRYALAFPEVRFTWAHEGRTLLQTSGSGDLFDVVTQVYGLETARQMLVFDSQQSGAAVTPEADPDDEIDFGGSSVTESLLDASLTSAESPLRVYGYASLPTLTRGNRTGVQIFVNRRAIEDRSLTHAVVQAYHTLLPVGRYPMALVFIEVDPAQIDVNVHPQKLQVRFAQERRVFDAVQKAVRRALIGSLAAPDFFASSTHSPNPASERYGEQSRDAGSVGAGSAGAGSVGAGSVGAGSAGWSNAAWLQRRAAILQAGAAPQFPFESPSPSPTPIDLQALANSDPVSHVSPTALPNAADAGEDTVERAGSAALPMAPESTPQRPPARADEETLPPLRVVGQIGATYIVAEGPVGLFLIDQHAAHERILYEQYMEQRNLLAQTDPPRQQLLQPLTLHAGTEAAGEVARHQRELAAVGYEIEPFGGDAWLVRSVPALLAGQDPLGTLIDIVDTLSAGRNLVREGYESELVKTICKRAAIKGGQLLSVIEMQELLRQLEACRAPRTCPHGRPTMLQISAGDLQRAFGRI